MTSNIFKNSQDGSTYTLRTQLRRGSAVTVTDIQLVLGLVGILLLLGRRLVLEAALPGRKEITCRG